MKFSKELFSSNIDKASQIIKEINLKSEFNYVDKVEECPIVQIDEQFFLKRIIKQSIVIIAKLIIPYWFYIQLRHIVLTIQTKLDQ